MQGVKLPDITLAQILAALSWIVGQAVATGVIDNNRAQLLVQIGTTVLSAVWVVADAIIRNGRAQIAAAAVIQGAQPPVKSANP